MNAPSRGPLRTYSHLQGAERIPTRYEIATSRILYYPGRGGFEVEVPLSGWYRKYQQGSPLRAEDWEAFADPRATTYPDYTRKRAEAESYVGSILASMGQNQGENPPSPAWMVFLGRTLPPLRFAAHALQMAAAYVGSMAPAGRIVVTSAMQAADEVRRIQVIARLTASLRALDPDFGRDAREFWQEDPIWQPLRRAIEQLLVTFDWGEALVALNLVLKPGLDALFLGETARLAGSGRGPLFAPLLESLYADAKWHEEWAVALLGMAGVQSPQSKEAIRHWCETWNPLAHTAVSSFAPCWEQIGAEGEFARALSAIASRRDLVQGRLTD